MLTTTSHRMLRTGTGTALATLALLALPAVAQGQDTAELPPASELVDRYVEAMGGRDAILRDAPTQATGTFEIPTQGLTGELVVVTAPPDRMVSKVTIGGMGEILSGYTGETAWALDPMSGARLMSGMELAALRDQADQRAAVRDPALIESMETVERTEMGGEPCYHVALVWVSGRETTDCYSVETGLLVATTATQASPMGDVEVTTLMEDYEEFAGVRIPTRVVQNMMGVQQIMRIDTMVVGDEVDTSLLEPPAPIQTLMESGSGG